MTSFMGLMASFECLVRGASAGAKQRIGLAS
jgi:hypothetical protein